MVTKFRLIHPKNSQDFCVNGIPRIHSCERAIRKVLIRLAKIKWGSRRVLGLFTTGTYRVRSEHSDGRYVWWIEHDLPPSDLYRCAAYIVEAISFGNRVAWTLRTGAGDYEIPEPTDDSIEAILVKAAKDQPLIIPRRMGAVKDY